MRWWKPALGIAIVAVIVIWDVGLPGGHSSPTTASANASAPASVSASAPATPSVAPTVPTPQVADIPGVLRPQGAPSFSATFTGTSLDSSIWATCYPYKSDDFGNGCTNFGNSTTENEWYLPSQVKVSNGTLNLVAQRTPTAGRLADGSPKTYACRSGMVTTYPGFHFKYGYIQVVAKIPTGSGLWPALWLAAASLQWPPEMDIVEAWGYSTPGAFFASNYFHYRTPQKVNNTLRGPISPASRAAGWHTFALSWTPTQITWLLDGKPTMTTRLHVPQQPMFFVADLAEAVTPAHPRVRQGQCNGELQIRSVQVWKD